MVEASSGRAHGLIARVGIPELPPGPPGVRNQRTTKCDHLACANAPSPFDFEHVGDSKRVRLTSRSASAPSVSQLLEFGIIELGQLRWRWNGGHDLLK